MSSTIRIRRSKIDPGNVDLGFGISAGDLFGDNLFGI